MTDTKTMQWECFCDEAYYHLWAVRPIGDRSFNSQMLFHVQSMAEAEALRDLLNKRADSAPLQPVRQGDDRRRENFRIALKCAVYSLEARQYKDMKAAKNAIVDLVMQYADIGKSWPDISLTSAQPQNGGILPELPHNNGWSCGRHKHSHGWEFHIWQGAISYSAIADTPFEAATNAIAKITQKEGD